MRSIHRHLGVRAAKLAICAAWLFIGLGVLITSIPANPFMPTARERSRVRALMPQGWAFFTKEAQEPDTFLYHQRADGTLAAIDGRAYRAFPLAGVDRRGRIRRGAASSLGDMLGPDMWTDCRGPVASCALPDQPVHVSDPPRFLDACGPLVIERRPPAPWMWFRRNPDFQMPSRIARVVIPC